MTLDHVMTWQDDGGKYAVKRLGAGEWRKRRESRYSQGPVWVPSRDLP